MTGLEQILQSAISGNQSQIDGLTADINRRRAERDGLVGSSAYDWRILGNALASGVGAAFGGGNIGEVMKIAGDSATTYYNNLKKDEDKKLANIGLDIASLESQRNDLTNFGQQLTGYGVQDASTYYSQLRTGQIPGSPAAVQKRQDEIALETAKAEARSAGNSLTPEEILFLNTPGTTIAPGSKIREDVVALKLRQQGQEIDKVQEKRRIGDKIRDADSLQAAGIEFVSTPRPDLVAKVRNENEAYIEFQDAKQQLADHIKRYGIDFVGTDSKVFDNLISKAMDAYRKFSGSGANFTLFEMDLARAHLPDRDMSKYLMAQMRGYGSADAAIQVLQRGMASDMKTQQSRLAAMGAYFPGRSIDPRVASQFGIPVDENGLAKKPATNWRDAYVSQLQSLSSQLDSPTSPVSPGAQGVAAQGVATTPPEQAQSPNREALLRELVEKKKQELRNAARAK